MGAEVLGGPQGLAAMDGSVVAVVATLAAGAAAVVTVMVGVSCADEGGAR